MGTPTLVTSTASRTSTSRTQRTTLLVILTLLLLSLAPTSPLSHATSPLRSFTSWVTWKLTPLPADPLKRAHALLQHQPIIDTHIDLPILARFYFANQLKDVPLEKEGFKGQVDIPRLRKGRVGGFFWSVYVGCPEDAGYPVDNMGNFSMATWRVRDTLEQIDVARLLIDKYSSTFEFVTSSKGWKEAMRRGKIASMLGVEGGHQLGNSLSTLRTYYALGVRYVTLTHTCHNALADSCGMQGTLLEDRWGGLSAFGEAAIVEMNRLGIMVDLSHTSPATSSQALSLSRSPPIFSHSNARGMHPSVRNIPDSLLRRIGGTLPEPSDGEGGMGWGGNGTVEAVRAGDALISLNFSPPFISDEGADVIALANHADYIGRLAGRDHVGIGSDFDGIATTPKGLEDVSRYPFLIAELITRGWTDKEIIGVSGGNLLRILEKTERVAREMKDVEPGTTVFEGRTDLVPHDHW